MTLQYVQNFIFKPLWNYSMLKALWDYGMFKASWDYIKLAPIQKDKPHTSVKLASDIHTALHYTFAFNDIIVSYTDGLNVCIS